MDIKNLPDHLYIMNQSQVLDSLSSKMSTWKALKSHVCQSL